MNTHIAPANPAAPAAITIHTGATTAQHHASGVCGRAFIYVGGLLVASARGATDADAVKEAVRTFRLTRHDRQRELAAGAAGAEVGK